jgi:hypothetical protein
LFENSGAYALLHVFAGARFENDTLDARAVQKMREDKAGGAGSDNSYLGSHDHRFLYQRRIEF